MDRAEPFSLDAFLNFILENTVTAMSQDLTAMEHYLNVTLLFNCDTNDNRRVWKKTEKGQFERALENPNKLFPWSGKSVRVCVTIAARLSRCSGFNLSLPVKIISLDD